MGVMLANVGNLLLLTFVTYYFHHTLPNSNNTQKHPCFCFGARFHTDPNDDAMDKIHSSGVHNNSNNTGEGKTVDAENGKARGRVVVTLRKVVKSFGRGAERFRAVDNLTMNIYAGEVSAPFVVLHVNVFLFYCFCSTFFVILVLSLNVLHLKSPEKK